MSSAPLRPDVPSSAPCSSTASPGRLMPLLTVIQDTRPSRRSVSNSLELTFLSLRASAFARARTFLAFGSLGAVALKVIGAFQYSDSGTARAPTRLGLERRRRAGSCMKCPTTVPRDLARGSQNLGSMSGGFGRLVHGHRRGNDDRQRPYPLCPSVCCATASYQSRSRKPPLPQLPQVPVALWPCSMQFCDRDRSHESALAQAQNDILVSQRLWPSDAPECLRVSTVCANPLMYQSAGGWREASSLAFWH